MQILLNASFANRSFPLNRNPGIQSVGVGEVIRRVIKDIAKKEVQQAAGSLQVCVGQDAGAKAGHPRNIFITCPILSIFV